MRTWLHARPPQPIPFRPMIKKEKQLAFPPRSPASGNETASVGVGVAVHDSLFCFVLSCLVLAPCMFTLQLTQGSFDSNFHYPRGLTLLRSAVHCLARNL